MHEQSIIEIVEEGYMLSFAYKWLGDKSVKAFSLLDFKGNRKKLAQKLHSLFNEADVTVAHNGNAYDAKWANREFITHGLTPPKPHKQVDTLLIARSRFKFNSNRLDALGEYLKLGRKLKHQGFPLWKACMRGEAWAFKEMCAYNKKDVELLELVYLKLRSWGNHPSFNSGISCGTCSSKNVIKRGYIRLQGGFRKQRWQCMNCGRWLLSNKKEKAKLIDGVYLK